MRREDALHGLTHLARLPVADSHDRRAGAAPLFRQAAGHGEEVGQAMNGRQLRAGIKEKANLGRIAVEAHLSVLT